MDNVMDTLSTQLKNTISPINPMRFFNNEVFVRCVPRRDSARSDGYKVT